MASAALHTLEDDAGVELIPGTEIMKDTEHAHFVRAHGDRGSVLVPQPEDDEHDPLNWSRTWKLIAVINQFVLVITSVIVTLAIAPLTPIYVEYFNVPPSRVALYTGVVVITLGYSNFFLVPMANVFGRRPMSILAGALCVGTSVWCALSKTDASFIAARAVSGIGAAVNESYMAMVVADIFFLHERGAWNGLYIFSYFGGTFVGPITAGAIAARWDWQRFFWMSVAMQSISLILLVFLFPETRYRRRDARFAGAETAAVEKTEEKGVTQQSSETEKVASTEVVATPVASTWVGRGRPSKQQFSLIQPIDKIAVKHIWLDVSTPVRIFFYPVICWGAFMLGWPANLTLAVNITQSAAFSAPPYNFTPSSVGLTNLALLCGGFIGLATAGPYSDWVSARATRKNNGVREAEMRLPALIPYFCIMVVSGLVLAFGWKLGWPWPAVVIIGMGGMGLQVTSLPVIGLTYAIDSFKPIAGEILTLATVCKNQNGFGQTYWMPDPYFARGDLFTPFMIVWALTVGTCLFGIPVYIWGKKLRRMTKNSSLHRM